MYTMYTMYTMYNIHTHIGPILFDLCNIYLIKDLINLT